MKSNEHRVSNEPKNSATGPAADTGGPGQSKPPATDERGKPRDAQEKVED
ncbi:hypothetical protein N8I74_13780 [Chitiniphilus purpureus]|uniref:Uncharacterized protein n=1 Tax=Chitiniphilus purpureus TaxID=2981137 RepID=A0ABY6DJ76_9NEIS|nr:hypothetical protein [Chitiniphilus sp. CD1]UXY14382.1 hypothetical protein N8I74_13780 [Chitiniphilus sp. CD1]